MFKSSNRIHILYFVFGLIVLSTFSLPATAQDTPSTLQTKDGYEWYSQLFTETQTPITEDQLIRLTGSTVHDVLHGHAHGSNTPKSIFIIRWVKHVINEIPSPRFLKAAYRLRYTLNPYVQQHISPADHIANWLFLFVISHTTETMYALVATPLIKSYLGPGVASVLANLNYAILIPGFDPLCFLVFATYSFSRHGRKITQIARQAVFLPLSAITHLLRLSQIPNLFTQDRVEHLRESKTTQIGKHVITAEEESPSRIRFDISGEDQAFLKLRFEKHNAEWVLIQIRFNQQIHQVPMRSLRKTLRAFGIWNVEDAVSKLLTELHPGGAPAKWVEAISANKLLTSYITGIGKTTGGEIVADVSPSSRVVISPKLNLNPFRAYTRLWQPCSSH